MLDLREDSKQGLPTQLPGLLGLAYSNATLAAVPEEGLDLRVDQKTTVEVTDNDVPHDRAGTPSGSQAHPDLCLDDPTESEPSPSESSPQQIATPARGLKRKAEESSCDIQRQILRVLQDILKVEKQRLEIETQKVKLLKMQQLHW